MLSSSKTLAWALAVFAVALPMTHALSLQGQSKGSKNNMYENIMGMPDNCINAPPVHNDYTPIGSSFVLKDAAIPDIVVYETGNKDSTKVVLAAYDIFGFSDNNTKQVTDILAAELNVRIAMPDYFRGSAFSRDNPSPSREEIAKFVGINGDWDDSVFPDTLAVIRHYKKNAGATSFGYFGWCWGGKITTLASMYIDDIDVAALVHPGNVELEEASKVRCPMYVMPGSDDVDMLPFYEVLQQSFGIQNSGHKRFDLPHGFAGGRSDFSNATIVAAVDQVVTIITEFFGPRLQ